MKNVSKRVITNIALAACVAVSYACSGSSGGSSPTQASDSTENGASSGQPSSSSGGPSSGGSSSGGSSSGGSSSGGSSSGDVGDGGVRADCVDVGGDWTGPVQGKAKANANDTTGTEDVTGTATVKLTASGNGNFAIASGSQFAVDIQTALGKVHQQEALQGTVSCGKLAATSSATVLGQTLSGTAQCTFDANGCTGTFEVHDSTNANVATGTFKLAR